MNAERISTSIHDVLWSYAFSRLAGEYSGPKSKVEIEINKWVAETAEKISMCHLNVIIFNEFGSIQDFEAQIHQLMYLRCGMIDGSLSKITDVTATERNWMLKMIADLSNTIVNAFTDGMKGTWVR